MILISNQSPYSSSTERKKVAIRQNQLCGSYYDTPNFCL